MLQRLCILLLVILQHQTESRPYYRLRRPYRVLRQLEWNPNKYLQPHYYHVQPTRLYKQSNWPPPFQNNPQRYNPWYPNTQTFNPASNPEALNDPRYDPIGLVADGQVEWVHFPPNPGIPKGEFDY